MLVADAWAAAAWVRSEFSSVEMEHTKNLRAKVRVRSYPLVWNMAVLMPFGSVATDSTHQKITSRPGVL